MRTGGFDRVVADGSGDDGTTGTDGVGSPDSIPVVCGALPNECTALSCGGSSSCYAHCSTALSWQAAATACAALGPGWCLATIGSASESSCLAGSIPQLNNWGWMGFYQPPNSPEPAGGWVWQCGTSAYVNWGAGTPNNAGGEDCGAVLYSGTWDDRNCALTKDYFCERP